MSYEEFEKKVKDIVRWYLEKFSKDDVEEFLKSEEVNDHIQNEYEKDLKKYKTGEISIDVLKNGCVSSVAYCLQIMF